MTTQLEKLASTFWQQGYLVIEDMFSAEIMDSLQGLILGHYGLNPEYEHEAAFLSKSATEVIPWFPQRSGEHAFKEIEDCKHMQSLTEEILGKNWKALYCMTMFSKMGTKGQAWHQDCPPDDPQQFNLNRLVYTMDINDQVGGELIVMPGSHRQGKLPAGEVNEDFAEQIALTPKKEHWSLYMDIHGTVFCLSKVLIVYLPITEQRHKTHLKISLTFVFIAICYINFRHLQYWKTDYNSLVFY